MSLHECFERHLAEGAQHEEKARKAEAEAATARRRLNELHAGLSTNPELAQQAVSLERKLERCLRFALSQWKLAHREFREAVRLRPHRDGPKVQLRAARQAVRGLQENLEAPEKQPVGRFLAHHNLSIRYWDLGKTALALDQSQKAREVLHRAGLPLGCTEHCALIMEKFQRGTAKEEKRLLAAVSKSPEAVGPSYALGVHYFDKRQIIRAEAFLKWAQERARAAGTLRLMKRDREKFREEAAKDWQQATSETAARADEKLRNCLEGLENDLEFLAELKEAFCVEDPEGRASTSRPGTGRASDEPCILPCLHRRFSADHLACDLWWEDLRSRHGIDLRAQGELPGRAA